MLHAILCYHSEKVVGSWTEEQDAAVMTRLAAVQEKLQKAGKLGPVARLMPTQTATTYKKDRESAPVMDGPYAETKEALLGFYIVDVADMDEALAVAKELSDANPGGGYEIRPVALMRNGATVTVQGSQLAALQGR